MKDEHAAEIEAKLEAPLLFFALLTIPVILLSVVENRWQWVRTHPLDVAIVVLTPPFLPPALQATRVFRLLRLLRLLKAGVLARRLLTAEGVKDAAILALLTILAGGAAFAAIEKDQGLSAWDGVWWAITTVTTVGYGDIQPATTEGRIIAVGVMFVGIGFVAILTAAAAERFMRPQRENERHMREQLDEVIERLDRIERASERESAPATID